MYQTVLYSREGLDSSTRHTIVSAVPESASPRAEFKLNRQEIVNRPSLTGKIGTENRTRWWLDIDYVVLTATADE